VLSQMAAVAATHMKPYISSSGALENALMSAMPDLQRGRQGVVSVQRMCLHAAVAVGSRWNCCADIKAANAIVLAEGV
jgi:hypothetical protein